MSLRQETHDLICVVLEDTDGQVIDDVAAEILNTLGLQGAELLVHLDPPTGLQTWLRSHGLSLVATAEAASPQVWEALDDGEETENLEEQEEGSPLLQVGDYVEYQTVPSGPQRVSRLGAGYVERIEADGVWVRPGLGRAEYLDPDGGDTIRLVHPATPEQTAPVLPW